MTLKRLNHAVLYVRDARTSAKFYTEVFGMEVVNEIGNGAGVFLRIPGNGNDHELAFFSMGAAAGDTEAGKRTVGLYHLAWQVENLSDLEGYREKLLKRGALVGQSDHITTKSLYGKDVDGIEFEVMWLVPLEQLTDEERATGGGIKPLDLQRELARFG